jgi:hypothetical protein
VWLEGIGQFKNSVTTSEIEPATFQWEEALLVARLHSVEWYERDNGELERILKEAVKA